MTVPRERRRRLVPALKGYLEIQSHRAGIDIEVEAGTIPPGLNRFGRRSHIGLIVADM